MGTRYKELNTKTNRRFIYRSSFKNDYSFASALWAWMALQGYLSRKGSPLSQDTIRLVLFQGQGKDNGLIWLAAEDFDNRVYEATKKEESPVATEPL